jgi:hypothetical protein
MLIQIELRDTDHKGRRLNNKVNMTHCRVIRQSGDGLRLENISIPIQRFYHAMTVSLLSKDPDNPEVDKVDKGSIRFIQANLARFLAPPEPVSPQADARSEDSRIADGPVNIQ